MPLTQIRDRFDRTRASRTRIDTSIDFSWLFAQIGSEQLGPLLLIPLLGDIAFEKLQLQLVQLEFNARRQFVQRDAHIFVSCQIAGIYECLGLGKSQNCGTSGRLDRGG